MFAEYLRSHWSEVRSKLLDLLGRYEDADLDYRPYEAAWTVRQLMLHIGHEEYGEVQHGITRELSAWPDEFAPADHPTVQSIADRLAKVHERTVALLAQLDDEGLAKVVETPWGTKDTMLALLGHVLEHEVHHRAELSLILGLLGRQGLDA